MPKINSKVFSADQQQRLRRMKNQSLKLVESFENIKCVSLYKLYEATEAELLALIPLIKKVITHNAKTAELIAEDCYRPDTVKADEYNIPLYNELIIKYDTHAGKTLKYKLDHKKEAFKSTIIADNQELFNNNLSIANDNAIKKLFNDIDISNYQITDRFLKREAKEADEKAIIINEEPITPKKERTKPSKKIKPSEKHEEGVEMDEDNKYYIIPAAIEANTNRATKFKYKATVNKLNELINNIDDMIKWDEPEKLAKLNLLKANTIIELKNII